MEKFETSVVDTEGGGYGLGVEPVHCRFSSTNGPMGEDVRGISWLFAIGVGGIDCEGGARGSPII
jgi:hypothetical protein